jgi:hypothetical protein
MARPVVEVVGRDQLVKTMKAAGVDIKDLNRANLAAAEIVAPAAAARAPSRTGRLAASGRPAGTRREAIVRFGGSAVRYGPPIHFGWPGHNIKPNPFAFEAAQSTEPQWTGVYESAIDSILEQVKGA